MKEFEPISNLIQAALPSTADAPVPDLCQQQLARFWCEQLGAAGLNSWPLLFTSGRLLVFTNSASWGNEIRHQSQSLMEALAAQDIFVTGIEVKTRPDSPWLQSIPPTRISGKPSRLSPENAAGMRSLAENIGHPGLRKSLLRLSKQVHSGKTDPLPER